MLPIQFYQKLPEMECLAGDTLPEFLIRTSLDDVSGCTMQLIIEDQKTPGAVALSKNCSLSDEVFHVQLTSEDTAGLLGVYRLHLCMTDSGGLKYRKLAGTLIVRQTALGG